MPVGAPITEYWPEYWPGRTVIRAVPRPAPGSLHTFIPKAGIMQILLASISVSGPNPGRNGLSRSGAQCNVQIQGALTHSYCLPLHYVDRRLILPFHYNSNS